MKTVQFKIYQPYGASGYCVDLFYRGRLLTGFMSNDLSEARANALTYAKNRGFTHIAENINLSHENRPRLATRLKARARLAQVDTPSTRMDQRNT